jgi:predicted transcriptional regulator
MPVKKRTRTDSGELQKMLLKTIAKDPGLFTWEIACLVGRPVCDVMATLRTMQYQGRVSGKLAPKISIKGPKLQWTWRLPNE